MKIIIIGPSNVGKTTLRKIFFEQESPLKLLRESLEPTRGVETSIYDIEGSLAVHDLAGQQLESWFTDNMGVFYDTDLIITMVDACDGWEENKQFWERTNFQRQRICPQARMMMLFHKVDLLDDVKKQELEWDISATFAGEHEITAFSSSIAPDYFLATFKKFVGGLRQGIMGIQAVEIQQVFQRVEVLTRFLDQETLDLPNLVAAMPFSEKMARKILEDMYKHNYIQIDVIRGLVTLGEQGLQLINSLNSTPVHASPRETFDGIPLVKGVLFSDDRGVCFFLYEYKPGFYNRLVPKGQEAPDPTMVSGMMSAIGGFASEIGQNAKTINITGADTQVLSQQHENLICIFFLESLPASQSLVELLGKFTQEFQSRFAEEITLVGTTGKIGQFSGNEGEIEEMVKSLNTDMHEHLMKQSPITGPQLFSLYQKVDQAGIDPGVAKDIKRLIFHYAITQDEQDLPDIDAVLEQYHIL